MGYKPRQLFTAFYPSFGRVGVPLYSRPKRYSGNQMPLWIAFNIPHSTSYLVLKARSSNDKHCPHRFSRIHRPVYRQRVFLKQHLRDHELTHQKWRTPRGALLVNVHPAVEMSFSVCTCQKSLPIHRHVYSKAKSPNPGMLDSNAKPPNPRT